jgi:hypothetical protein
MSGRVPSVARHPYSPHKELATRCDPMFDDARGVLPLLSSVFVVPRSNRERHNKAILEPFYVAYIGCQPPTDVIEVWPQFLRLLESEQLGIIKKDTMQGQTSNAAEETKKGQEIFEVVR